MVTDQINDLERSAWSMFASTGLGPGGRVVDTPTRLVVESPVPRPPYNGVWRFLDEGDRPLRQQAEELLMPMNERGVSPVWLVHPTTDPRIRDVLLELGMVRAEEAYGMYAELAEIDPPPTTPDGIEVVELSADDSQPWLELVSWRYGLAEESSDYLRGVYEETLERGTRCWVALVDGQPASKAVLHLDNGVAGIYGVATTEAGRGRGLATLVCATALEAARVAGIRRTVLHSTPMARSLYQRLGYRDVTTFELWAAPDTLHL
jgi:ribosomal protein S18 acetylase RimI-like enzyme